MELTITKYPYGARPDVTKPDPEFYNQLREEGMRQMVSKHYDLLRASDLKHLFPADDAEFENAKSRSADFMIQICGGPDYFNQHRGRPRMTDRHAPFSINMEGRNIWLNCYKKVLLELPIPEHLILSFWNYIDVFSIWIVNTPTPAFKVNKL